RSTAPSGAQPPGPLARRARRDRASVRREWGGVAWTALSAVCVRDSWVVLTPLCRPRSERDRKSTRLNSSHEWISYAVCCLKKTTVARTMRTLADSVPAAMWDTSPLLQSQLECELAANDSSGSEARMQQARSPAR